MKKGLIIAAVVIVALAAIGSLGGKKEDVKAPEEVKAEEAEKVEPQEALEEVTEESEAQEEVVDEPDDDLTASQRNAVKQAESYLEFTAFSRAGLINQLSSEYGNGYPEEDAEFAVQYLEDIGAVDWNDQAAKSAEHYLEVSAFSRKGLINQLSSDAGEKFTQDQAEYGVQYLEDNNLVDWKEQAAKSAANYLEFSSFSESELLNQLSSDAGEGFTQEEAEYAISQVY